MRRRNFLKYSIAASLLQGVNSGLANTAINSKELDKYGGWKGKKFKATGFFRAEKDERWWLVTPEGNAFISRGINHFATYLFQQKYNVWPALAGCISGTFALLSIRYLTPSPREEKEALVVALQLEVN